MPPCHQQLTSVKGSIFCYLRQTRHVADECPLWVTCGQRHGKIFFDVAAALVGCGHVSGLLMRQVWPLALMLCADRVLPIVCTHLKVR
jgi:hypothetical protein